MAQSVETLKSHNADSHQGIAGIGPQTESQEMCLGSSASDRIPGFSGEFKKNEDLSAGGEDSEGDEGVQAHNQQEVSDSLTPSPLDRATVIDSTGSHCGTPPLSRSSEVAPESPAEVWRKLRSRDICRQRGRSRSAVVNRTPARIQRSPSCPTLGRHGIYNRCLKIWLESNRSGMQYRWCVDSGREKSPHKLPGDESSSISLADLPLSKAEYSHPVAARQPISHCIPLQLISHCIHKPQRGTHSKVLSDLTLGVVLDLRNNNTCRAHSGSVQHSSRCRVEAEIRAE